MKVNEKIRAFTLIELLVVVAIISLLVSILMPSLNQAKKLAKCTMCKSNLFNIGTAICQYADEYNERLPSIYAGLQNCCAYWFYYDQEFRNLGLLAKAGFFSCQTDIVFCPSWKAGSAASESSHGVQSHINCISGSQLAATDASLGWTHKRSSYFRRVLDDDGNRIVSLSDIGPQAWLGDLFVFPVHIQDCHGDGINTWYGDGHVEYNNIDMALLEEISSSENWQNIWDVIIVR